jgi:FkbM family methyltransferase
MLQTLKRVFPLREIARIIDLHFQTLDQILFRIEEVRRVQREGAERARSADRESAQDHAAVLKALTYVVGQVAALQTLLKPPITLPTEDFDLRNPDVGLLAYLFCFLSNGNALDIGANTGEISQRLLDAGYEVFAFEPFPPIFAQLASSLANREHFHANHFAIACMDGEMDLHIVSDEFARKAKVPVRSLQSLRQAGEIPAGIGVIKLDTEGYDLEVIRGMGDCSCQVLMANFWDRNMPFGKSGAMNRLDDLVAELRPRGYRWYIVIYRLEGKPISYYCNQPHSVGGSWGNAIFFKDQPIFQEALQWCSAVLPVTYFRSGQ